MQKRERERKEEEEEIDSLTDIQTL